MINKTNSFLKNTKNRIGFHYFPDTLHYRDSDLQRWLPELTALKASWLVLESPIDRAIPESFISGLVQVGIQPIIHFKMAKLGSTNQDSQADATRLEPILASYSRWGVRHVIFFDKPNSRASWSPSAWVQQSLVERFLDQFLPLAEQAIQHGLNPVFPPLEPGGHFWDTAFLRAALDKLVEKKQTLLLQNLVLAAYSWNKHDSLNWGSGGPQRWTETHPYFTPANQEDERGFRIFDWYNAITQTVLQRTCPVLLLGAGAPNDPVDPQPQVYNDEQHTAVNLAIIRLLNGESPEDPGKTGVSLDPVPDSVIGCNFWLLSADQGDPFQKQGWYQGDGQARPTVQVYKNYLNQLGNSPVVTASKTVLETSRVENKKPDETAPAAWNPVEDDRTGQITLPQNRPSTDAKSAGAARDGINQTMSDIHSSSGQFQHPIQHYLLLPSYDWGVADWHLDVIKPFIKKYRPTVGFSIKEAALAKRVTVIGNTQTFPEPLLDQLRQVGCLVERISGDGTSVATQLAER